MLRDERNVSVHGCYKVLDCPRDHLCIFKWNKHFHHQLEFDYSLRSNPEYASYLLDDPLISLSNDCREELNKSALEYSRYARELEDSMILPYVVYDVNHAERYGDLEKRLYLIGPGAWI